VIVKVTLQEHGVSGTDTKELKSALDAEPTPAANGFGPNVAAWMGKMVGKAVEGSWKIATSAAGSVLGKALARYYGMP
jgi:hypothetical protein